MRSTGAAPRPFTEGLGDPGMSQLLGGPTEWGLRHGWGGARSGLGDGTGDRMGDSGSRFERVAEGLSDGRGRHRSWHLRTRVLLLLFYTPNRWLSKHE